MTFDRPVRICLNVSVAEDSLVEENERFQLQLTTDDTAIVLVEPFIAEIMIINSDGEFSQ